MAAFGLLKNAPALSVGLLARRFCIPVYLFTFAAVHVYYSKCRKNALLGPGKRLESSRLNVSC